MLRGQDGEAYCCSPQSPQVFQRGIPGNKIVALKPKIHYRQKCTQRRLPSCSPVPGRFCGEFHSNRFPRKSGCSPLNLLKYCEDRLTPSHVGVEFMAVSE